jgi:hypothetical protein
MFEYLSKQQKSSVLLVLALCLPAEYLHSQEVANSVIISWSYDMLNLLTTELSMPREFIDVYVDLALCKFSETKQRNTSMVEKMKHELIRLEVDTVRLLVEVMCFLLTNGKYDARGRCLSLELCEVMSCPITLFFRIEYILSSLIRKFQRSYDAADTQSTVVNQANSGKKRMMRYAKIGAATVGAGVVIAVTGGLAAPAIAGALLITLGSSSGMNGVF